jgi:hypothetical protein
MAGTSPRSQTAMADIVLRTLPESDFLQASPVLQGNWNSIVCPCLKRMNLNPRACPNCDLHSASRDNSLYHLFIIIGDYTLQVIAGYRLGLLLEPSFSVLGGVLAGAPWHLS